MAKRKSGGAKRASKPSVSARKSASRKPAHKKKRTSYKTEYEKLVKQQAKEIQSIKDLLTGRQQPLTTAPPKERAGRVAAPSTEPEQVITGPVPKDQQQVLDELHQLQAEIQQRAMILDELMSGPGKIGGEEEYFK